MGRPRKNTSNSSNYYIDPNEFADELKLCQQRGECSTKMYEMFKELARKCSGSFVYTSNDDRQDCINHAVVIMAQKFMKYDFSRTECAGPFSYFTSVAFNGLRAGWNELNGHNSRTYRIDQIFKED